MIEKIMTLMAMMMSSIVSLLISQKLCVKKTWKVLNNFFFINLGCIVPFDYKFTIITKICLFKGYIDATHVDEGNLRF